MSISPISRCVELSSKIDNSHPPTPRKKVAKTVSNAGAKPPTSHCDGRKGVCHFPSPADVIAR